MEGCVHALASLGSPAGAPARGQRSRTYVGVSLTVRDGNNEKRFLERIRPGRSEQQRLEDLLVERRAEGREACKQYTHQRGRSLSNAEKDV